MTTTTRATSPARPSAHSPSLPRLLAGVQTDAPLTLEQHLARYGAVPWQGPPRRGVAPLITMIEESGLRGRGGGAFPTGRKLRTVAAGRGRPVVVANGTEGEPVSFKDKLLLATMPHLVLDGAALAAEAIGADEVVVAIDRAARASLRSIAHAIGTRQRGRLDPVPFRLVEPKPLLKHARRAVQACPKLALLLEETS